MRIGVIAPSCPLDESLPLQIKALAQSHFGSDAPEIVFHPQCFLSEGHFAGPDSARTQAFVEFANDSAFDAVWCARGGYGACRIAGPAIGQLGPAAHDKLYLGYSDAGFLLGGLYARGIGRVAHGPMPADLGRDGGQAALLRALDWFVNPDANKTGHDASAAIHITPPLVRPRERVAAFNLTVLCAMIGTPLMPDLTDHVLMVEEVGEYMYRIDRSLFQLTSNPTIRAVAGIKLGRISAVPDNLPNFAMNEEQLIAHWCAVSGIAYLGRADIGHDGDNKVVPFG